MIRSMMFVCAAVCASCLSHEAFAGAPVPPVEINLDLQFSDPSDMNSGGDWTISAQAPDFGLAGMFVQLDEVNEPVTFLISNTIFEVQMSGFLGSSMILDVTAGDNLATPTYNVGVGSPVDIAAGTFAPGDVPFFVDWGANIFSSPTATNGSATNSTTSVTSNFVPEPTTLVLFGLGIVGAVTTARRRG